MIESKKISISKLQMEAKKVSGHLALQCRGLGWYLSNKVPPNARFEYLAPLCFLESSCHYIVWISND